MSEGGPLWLDVWRWLLLLMQALEGRPLDAETLARVKANAPLRRATLRLAAEILTEGSARDE